VRARIVEAVTEQGGEWPAGALDQIKQDEGSAWARERIGAERGTGACEPARKDGFGLSPATRRLVLALALVLVLVMVTR
jgi:hypothetical protein